MALDLKNSNKQWSSLKTDNESAYKHLPIGPDRSRYAIVALRHPQTGTWFAFRPPPLLFGAEAAVAHYSCFPRALEVLANCIFAKP